LTPCSVPVSEITRLFTRVRDEADGLRRVLAVDLLLPSEDVVEQLASTGSGRR
jgi:hypothetical protein